MSRWVILIGLLALGCDDGGGGGSVVDAGVGDAGPDASPSPCGTTSSELLACADMTRYAEDLEFVARPRGPEDPHLQAVRERCATVFAEAGFDVEMQAYGTGMNVIGVRPGVSKPDEHVLVSAHYDHIPGCIGADDNASGTAGVLEAARVLGQQTFARTVVVACWDEEEAGLIGSRAYARRAAQDGMNVFTHLVFEMIGNRSDRPGSQLVPDSLEFVFPDVWAALTENEFRGDFITILHDDITPQVAQSFGAHAEALGLSALFLEMIAEFRTSPAFGDFRRSDHAPFWDEGLPAIQITDTANFRNSRYHCSRGQDEIGTIDMGFAFQVTQATIGAAADAAEIMEGTPGEVSPPGPEVPPPAPACDVIAQDCPNGQRCTLLFGEDAGFACIDQAAEPVGPGVDCVRPDNVGGEDTCAQGTYCAFWHMPQTDPVRRNCYPFCRASSDCGDGMGCRLLGGAPAVGLCVPICSPGDAEACPEGNGCAPVSAVEYGHAQLSCFFAGELAHGEACAAGECQAGHSCKQASGRQGLTCAQLCSGPGECPDGDTCYPDPRPGLPDGFGYCYPTAE